MQVPGVAGLGRANAIQLQEAVPLNGSITIEPGRAGSSCDTPSLQGFDARSDPMSTRVSLVFVASYLLLTGLGLALAPGATLALLGSTVDYGPVMPRWVGMFSIALAAVIVQVLRHRLAVLYPMGFFMPGAMLFGFAALYLSSGDTLFLAVMAVVGAGVAMTGLSLWLDRQRAQRAGSAAASR